MPPYDCGAKAPRMYIKIVKNPGSQSQIRWLSLSFFCVTVLFLGASLSIQVENNKSRSQLHSRLVLTTHLRSR